MVDCLVPSFAEGASLVNDVRFVLVEVVVNARVACKNLGGYS